MTTMSDERMAAYQRGRADERKRLLCDREKHPRRWRKEGGCRRCEDEDRRAACDHSGSVRSDWAGILGYRYYCSRCGASVPDPDPA